MRVQNWIGLAQLGLIAFFAAGQAVAAETEPRTITPSGTYALLRLEIEGREGPLFVPFRDGKGRVDHGIGIAREGGWITRSGDNLTGTFETTPTADLQPKDNTSLLKFSLNATLRGDRVSGACTVNGKEVEVTGTWQTQEQIAASNAIPPENSWPMWTGPIDGGTAAQRTGVALVDSFAAARLVWRSEQSLSNCMGSVRRDVFYKDWTTTATKRTAGQSSSPVLGGGKVFVHDRIPAGEETRDLVRGEQLVADAKAAGYDQVPWFAVEKHLLVCDEVIAAMDAATGKTLWTTSFPGQAPNKQSHKDRGGDRSPAYVDGKLVVLCYHGNVVCLDAATGKVDWEKTGNTATFNTAVTAAGRVVAVPLKSGKKMSWSGIDVPTGQVLWQRTESLAGTAVGVWSSGGKDYFLVPTTEGNPLGSTSVDSPVTLQCVESRTGEVPWRIPFAMGTDRLGLTVVGDFMVTYERALSAAPIKQAAQDDNGSSVASGFVCGYKLSLKGAEKIWSVPISVPRYSQPIILNRKFVVAAGRGTGPELHKVIDLESGKVLSTISGPAPENGGYVMAMEDLVFVRPDGTHGRIEFAGYKVDSSGQIRALEPLLWAPPGPHTTSYHHPFMYPLVDGRMFVRQADGIYCYDLRKH